MKLGGVVMNNTDYKPLDLKKLKDKKHVATSTEDALKDITPIKWDDEVANGNKRVLLVSKG